MIRRCAAALLACLLPVCLFPVAAGAASSWQVRTYPGGSGTWATRTDTDAIRVFGVFDGGNVWETYNAGLSGSLVNGGLAIPADSIALVADEGEAIVARGHAWFHDYFGWGEFPAADSIGVITAAAGNEYRSNIHLLGTAAGLVYRYDGTGSAPSRIGDFEGVPVRRFYGRGDQVVRLILADGRIFVQGDAWTASPMRALVAGFRDDLTGYAVEEGTLRLWSTTDGGVHWEARNDTLAAPSLSAWAARARGIAIDETGRGVIPCGDAILMTRDAGASWSVAAMGTDMFLDAAIDQQGQILTVGRRLHRCASGAFDLEQVGDGDFARTVMGSAATFWAQDGGLLLSVDQGRRWYRHALPDSPGRLRRIAAIGEYDLWLQFDGEEGSRAYRTMDRGNTFLPLDPPGLLHGAIAWVVPDTATAWAATREAVLRSVNGGLDWRIVRERLDGIQALAAPDSLRAAVRTATSFIYTTDGGASWVDGPPPPADPFTALDFTPGGEWAATGAGIYRASVTEGWTIAASVSAGDTLRDLAVAPDGTGWAVGTSGLLLGSEDAGRSWAPYRLNLELNAIDTTFVHLSLLDGGDALTGVGRKLIRFLPDHTGPIFRIGVSSNPFLPRRLDIHVTARERLRGDSLRVKVDDATVPSTLIDPAGFLYRARFEIPAVQTEQLLTVSGRDWLGNERSDARPLLALVLDADGRAQARWGGAPVRFAGGAATVVTLLGTGEEIEMTQPDRPVLGSPFTVTVSAPTAIEAADPAVDLIRWDGRGWTAHDGRLLPPGTREVWALARATEGTPAEDPLRVYPVPSHGTCTIQWIGSGRTTVRWELFDLSGRRIAAGALPAGGGGVRWSAVDAAGRALPSGIYWLRASAGREGSTRRILIER